MAKINMAVAFLVALLICNSGVAETRCEYDADIRSEYDANGNLTKLLCFDVDGKPKPVEDGIEEIRYEYDSDGNLTRESYFGVDGKPKASKDGVFEVRREYDNAGNVIRGVMIMCCFLWAISMVSW